MHGLLVCRDELILPLRALKNGHLLFLGYTAAFVSLGVWGAAYLIDMTTTALTQASSSINLEPLHLRLLTIGISVLVWALSIPVYITAIALPVRVLWMKGNLQSWDLFSLALPSIARSLRALGHGIRLQFRYLIPVAVMAVLYFGFAEKLAQKGTTQLFLLGFIGVAVSTFWKVLPVFLAPVLAVSAQFDGRDAVRFSEQVFRPKALDFIVIVLCALALCLGIFEIFHGRLLRPRMYFSLPELTLYGMVIWYTLCMICFKTMQSLALASSRESSAQPSPQQGGSSPPQQQVIHIENLWVQEEDGKFKVKKP